MCWHAIEFCSGARGMAPADVWRMTMREYAATISGYRKANAPPGSSQGRGEALTDAELAALMADYPDTPPKDLTHG